MRIKLDENLPRSAGAVFAEAGQHDVETVAAEGLSGTDDDTLIAVARSEQRLLVTLDRGFGDVRRYPPGTHSGIVVLRLADHSEPAAVEAMSRLVRGHDLEDLRGAITVVETSRLRIRRPPGGS